MTRLDRSGSWRVHLNVKALSPLILGTALAFGAGACGGKDKKPKTTPSGSTGSVSEGTPLDPSFDPAEMNPEGDIPSAAPNDRPPNQGDPDEGSGEVAGDDTPPEPRPPGLDISPAEKKAKVYEHLQQASSAIQNNSDPARTIEQAKAALQIDETSIEAMVLLAHGNFVKGYYDLAEDVLLKAFERGGKSNKQAYFLLGLVYEKTKRPEKAPSAYQNALTLDPNYKSAIMNLGVHDLSTKRYADAVRAFERLTSELGMNDASVWTNLGSAYRGLSLEFAIKDVAKRNKLVQDAELAYKRAISIDKNYGHAYYNMGLLYLDADPFPTPSGEMDRVLRLKQAKTYFDEYRRLAGADQELVDATTAVAQKLIDREEILRKKKADREARRRALEEKKRKREEAAAAGGGGDDEFDEGGFE
ncbi:MAG: hypothetical protein GY811_13815 [Myxococcales bacterium]|nr:hypothetical protein [Myxococcales bacterium]